MAQGRRTFSSTLPKDFMFHAFDEPRTPTRPFQEPEGPPPPPHHSSYRLRRPRLDLLPQFGSKMIPFCSPDTPLPSIEFSQAVDPPSSDSLHQSSTAQSQNSLLDVPQRERCDPKTPEAQVFDDVVALNRNWRDEKMTPRTDPISRPSSACSNLSDSSVSSSGSFDSRPSFGGSCTSPESEISDPFVMQSYPERKQPCESPCKYMHSRGLSLQLPAGPRWTLEMDNHLWNTYQMYLQDPTITPFKTIPGSLPPLGVSHRVSREARRTWPRVKHGLSKNAFEETGKDVELKNEMKSGSCTPTAGVSGSTKPLWPHSDASTRKRLKQLCRRRFSIAPHYQRLLQSRSPSPFPEPFVQSSSNSLPVSGSYGSPNAFSRDLGVSLVATSLPANIPKINVENRHSSPPETDWFNKIAEKPSEVGLETQQVLQPPVHGGPALIPRLGSPFMYRTWGPDNLRRRVHSAAVNLPETVHGTGSRLRSSIPPEMLPGAHKRRAINQLEDEVSPDRNAPTEYLPQPLKDNGKNQNYRRVRLRNRGATMGGLNSRDRLSQLFTPPSLFSSNESSNNVAHSSTSQVEAPKEEIKRLGSPFNLDLSKGRRMQSRHAPSRSESFILWKPTRARAASLQNAQTPRFEIGNTVTSHLTPEVLYTDAQLTPTPEVPAPDAHQDYL
ncbi:hypothetical protein LOZ53_006435 [Ophidiomyces ophidiicola]|nr:hypothetical protein LOZ55_002069 [Ophidiomyces ophidiicola]KAI1981512.1 hypothetical protein LOZ53_006435 [Ophidiomyces ophidiicola]KAI1981731.1 hypothetical protein LOZ54_005537 [Ophidiomyces ophidiicola]KAI1991062.1 hypothetical protein LOZ51_004592 [Ophidiomyces ophidiicola]